MKVAIVGTRFDQVMNQNVWMDVGHLVEKLAKDTVIVSGGAPGVDTFAWKWAETYGLPEPIIIRPKWLRPDGSLDKAAGFARNTQIVETSDVVIAFWDGESRGTKDTITKARKAGKLLMVYEYTYPEYT
mgnify:CR=1 FL=1